MTADVIIPVYRPDARLKECLHRLEAQTVKPTKIILMNTEECCFDPFRDGWYFPYRGAPSDEGGI